MSQFEYLKPRNDLYKAMTEVEKRIDTDDWDVAVQKMRTTVQVLVQSFFELYGVDIEGSLDDQINALKKAQLISPESANAYHEIRMNGNRVSHENVAVSKEEALLLYIELIGEVTLFTEKYSVDLDPDGGRALEEAMTGKPSKKENRILSSTLVRVIGVFYICAGAFFFIYFSRFMERWNGGNTAFGIFFPVICGLAVLVGLYSLITGDETLILLNWILR